MGKDELAVRAGRGRKRKLRSGGNHQGEAGLTSREVAGWVGGEGQAATDWRGLKPRRTAHTCSLACHPIKTTDPCKV